MENQELVDDIICKIADLKNMNDLLFISRAIKRRRNWLGQEIGTQLQRGDKVRVSSGTGIEYGEVIKVNRTRAVIRIDNRQWNVPFSMITKEVNSG